MPSLPTPEHGACYRWLLAACRSWLARRTGRLVDPAPSVPPPSLDWAILETMARCHCVEPILHLDCTQRPSLGAHIPEGLRATWERSYYGTLIRNSEVLALLSHLSTRCDEAGIPLIVLKGPSVMAEVYGDIGLRPMVDLDVLCHRGDLLAVRDILTSIGFPRVGTPYLYQVDFQSDKGNMLVELHFDVHHLVRRRARFLESAWKDRIETAIEDWRFPVFSPEHQLVFELGHAAWHRFDLDLRHLVEFAGRLLMRPASFDDAKLWRLLAESGLVAEYSLFVGALARMLDLPLDTSTGQGLTPDRRLSFEQQMLERSSSIGFVEERRTGSAFLREPGLARKVAFAWKRLVPPMPAMRAAYNLRTPMQSLFCLPVHVARTLSDLQTRAKAGF